MCAPCSPHKISTAATSALADWSFCGDGGDLGLLAQQAYHVVGGPVIEAIDVDLGLVHVTNSALSCSAVLDRVRCRDHARLSASCAS